MKPAHNPDLLTVPKTISESEADVLGMPVSFYERAVRFGAALSTIVPGQFAAPSAAPQVLIAEKDAGKALATMLVSSPRTHSASDRRDAERYRWLKAQAHKGHYLTVDDATVALVFQMEEGTVLDADHYGLTLDAAIDRALKGSGG